MLAILAGLLSSKPAIANSPTIQSEEESSVINPPYGPPRKPDLELHDKAKTRSQSGRYSTRAEKTIAREKLEVYLSGSPLASYSQQLLDSRYWSTIIGICWIEQNKCTRAPSWNYWGIKGSGKCGTFGKGFARYCTAEEGIQAISDLLARY